MIVDEAALKVMMHVSSTVKINVEKYVNEYVIVLHMMKDERLVK